MEEELLQVDSQMKSEIDKIKEKYNEIKKDIKKKYKKIVEKKPRKTIPKTVKSDVWDKYIGKANGLGKCECCSKEIDSKNFECGHVKSVKDNGDDTVENLRPVCGECNKSMGTQHLYEFKEKHYKPKTLFQIQQEKAISDYQRGINLMMRPAKFNRQFEMNSQVQPRI